MHIYVYQYIHSVNLLDQGAFIIIKIILYREAVHAKLKFEELSGNGQIPILCIGLDL